MALETERQISFCLIKLEETTNVIKRLSRNSLRLGFISNLSRIIWYLVREYSFYTKFSAVWQHTVPVGNIFV